MAEGQEGRDAYCPCCRHCNPPPEPTDPMPRWTQPKLPREAVRLDGFKVKVRWKGKWQ